MKVKKRKAPPIDRQASSKRALELTQKNWAMVARLQKLKTRTSRNAGRASHLHDEEDSGDDCSISSDRAGSACWSVKSSLSSAKTSSALKLMLLHRGPPPSHKQQQLHKSKSFTFFHQKNHTIDIPMPSQQKQEAVKFQLSHFNDKLRLIQKDVKKMHKEFMHVQHEKREKSP